MTPDPLALAAMHLFVTLIDKLNDEGILDTPTARAVVQETITSLTAEGNKTGEKAAGVVVMFLPHLAGH